MEVYDIKFAKYKYHQRMLRESDEAAQRRKLFDEIKSETVKYYCNYYNSIICNNIEKGIIPMHRYIEYKNILDYIHHTHSFFCEDDECFEVMDAIVYDIKEAYQKAGYNVEISKFVGGGSHLTDSYRFSIKFN